MRVALVSFESPVASHLGGIASYIGETARSLVTAGAEVEVFTHGVAREERWEAGVRYHLVPGERVRFPRDVVGPFAERHHEAPFDVVEAPDYQAEGLGVKERFPEIPLVVKLHTPYTLLLRNQGIGFFERRLRRGWYRLRTGRRLPPTQEELWVAAERVQFDLADGIAAPSIAVAREVRRCFGISGDRISHYPYPYSPDSALLRLPLRPGLQRLVFFGRLELRKGVVELAKAFRIVRRTFPGVELVFVGAEGTAGPGGCLMSDLLRREAGEAGAGIRFVGQIPRARLPELLGQASIAVLPSRWESFGFVVLEAMAAGCAVICSSGGGMQELAGDGKYAFLAPPGDHEGLASVMLQVLGNPEAQVLKAGTARREGLDRYRPELVAKAQLDHYEACIRRRRR